MEYKYRTQVGEEYTCRSDHYMLDQLVRRLVEEGPDYRARERDRDRDMDRLLAKARGQEVADEPPEPRRPPVRPEDSRITVVVIESEEEAAWRKIT